VWRRRHRLKQLETEVAAGKADRTELRRRLDMFEQLAASAGAAQDRWQSAAVPAAPMPPTLAAAGRDLRTDDVPVRLDVAGNDVVAVVGGEGDPREWWTAIWELAGPQAAGVEGTTA